MKKFTTLETDLLKEAAGVQEAFATKYESATRKLEDISQLLENLKEDHERYPRDWSIVGSLGHVNEELDDIIEFLSSSSNVYRPLRDNTLPEPPDGGSGV